MTDADRQEGKQDADRLTAGQKAEKRGEGQEKKLKAKLYNVFTRQNTRLRDQSCRQ